MILIIDNYDSFTYNLYQQIAGLGHDAQVVKNDEISLANIKKLAPTHIVISPGPGRPDSSGISRQVIQDFYRTTPILGSAWDNSVLARFLVLKQWQRRPLCTAKLIKSNMMDKACLLTCYRHSRLPVIIRW